MLYFLAIQICGLVEKIILTHVVGVFWFVRVLYKNSMNYARSGATWSHTKNTKRDIFSYEEKLSDNNVVLNQVLRLIKDTKELRCSKPDYIFVMAGTNDAWFQNKTSTTFF